MDNLFGLPAHPLVVHAAVVLVPLAALGTIVIAVAPRWRQRLGVVVLGLALVGFVFAFLAKESGESLEERVAETQLVEDHAELGDLGVPVALGVVVASGALVGLDVLTRRRVASGADAPGWEKPVGIVVPVVAVLLSVASTAVIVQIGHSGAKATWNDVDKEKVSTSGTGGTGETPDGDRESGEREGN